MLHSMMIQPSTIAGLNLDSGDIDDVLYKQSFLIKYGPVELAWLRLVCCYCIHCCCHCCNQIELHYFVIYLTYSPFTFSRASALTDLACDDQDYKKEEFHSLLSTGLSHLRDGELKEVEEDSKIGMVRLARDMMFFFFRRIGWVFIFVVCYVRLIFCKLISLPDFMHLLSLTFLEVERQFLSTLKRSIIQRDNWRQSVRVDALNLQAQAIWQQEFNKMNELLELQPITIEESPFLAPEDVILDSLEKQAKLELERRREQAKEEEESKHLYKSHRPELEYQNENDSVFAELEMELKQVDYRIVSFIYLFVGCFHFFIWFGYCFLSYPYLYFASRLVLFILQASYVENEFGVIIKEKKQFFELAKKPSINAKGGSMRVRTTSASAGSRDPLAGGNSPSPFSSTDRASQYRQQQQHSSSVGDGASSENADGTFSPKPLVLGGRGSCFESQDRSESSFGGKSFWIVKLFYFISILLM
jgi:hypothetical protein